jgi:hypothetical protein
MDKKMKAAFSRMKDNRKRKELGYYKKASPEAFSIYKSNSYAAS